ncbi:MAG TPA: TIGR03560 family F420-dependent LLM class oxidoreductase [Dehalococcoidia bacterium]
MRFGIQTSLNNVEWREIEDMWRFLDKETRFHSAWTFDHFVPPGPGQDVNANCFEGWAALAALAPITDRIRLGCLVTGVTYREPAVLAKMAVTIDHASKGRLEFGIGAAWHQLEHRMYGIPFYDVKERQDRLEEATQIIRLLFDSDSPVTFEGKHYRVENAVFLPKSVQKPHPPIMIGGGGEKRTLRTLARYGDVMNVSGTPEQVKAKVAVLEQHCRDVGRDPSEIRKTVFGTIVVSENQGLIDRIAAMFGAGMGLKPDEAKRIMPIGSPEHVRSVVAKYADIGVSEMIMMSQGPWKQDVYRRISDEVISAFE